MLGSVIFLFVTIPTFVQHSLIVLAETVFILPFNLPLDLAECVGSMEVVSQIL
jgi:hypothetical protein